MTKEIIGYHVIQCPACHGAGGFRVSGVDGAPIKRYLRGGVPRDAGYTSPCHRCQGQKFLVEVGDSQEVKELKQVLSIALTRLGPPTKGDDTSPTMIGSRCAVRSAVRFSVIDNQIGKPADTEQIALTENWASHLIYCDMEGFAITEDGALVLLDECGNYAWCPPDRFWIGEAAEANDSLLH